MKHQTPESMKFRKLMRHLGQSRLVCVGTLELLWIATQKNAPQGDIGRFTNEEIAIECEWEGDPDQLVEALVKTDWLDVCDTHRLLVHDWHEHAPGWVSRQLKRHKKEFFTVTRDAPPAGQASLVTSSSLLSVTDDTLEATPNLTQPNPTKGNLRKGSEPAPNVTGDAEGPEGFIAPTPEEVQTYADHHAQLKPGWPKDPFDAETFCDHYASNGWRQGNGVPIVDWQASVRSWGRRTFARGRGSPGGGMSAGEVQFEQGKNALEGL